MSVELLGHLGDDLTIVNAARVSYAKRSDAFSESDRGLIGYLMRERHGTPFEMVQFQFHVTVPIGVAREWQRHRMGSFNEVSTRYVQMEPLFYVPPDEAIRAQTGKPGHYQMEPVENRFVVQAAQRLIEDGYNAAYRTYESLLRLGVARELARNVLPLGLLTEFYWGVNLRSLLNFLSLRTAPTALLEIRQEACEIERLVTEIVPVALAAWNANGRIAP